MTNENDVEDFVSPGITTPYWSTQVVRPDDLMVLTFSFHNLALRYVDLGEGEIPVLERREPQDEAYIVVGFPSQHFAEDLGAVEVNEGQPPPAWLPRCAAAPPSRLAFRVPSGTHMLRYELSSQPLCLLDWTSLVLSRVPAAVPPGFNPSSMSVVPELKKPLPHQTAIWLPDGLVLSPLGENEWRHDDSVRKSSGRCLLWHTSARASKGGDPTPLRAVWCKDLFGGTYAHEGDPVHIPSRMDLRHIVQLTSGFSIERPNLVRPLMSRFLMLSAYGAWADIGGKWEQDNPTGLSEWVQRVSMGRDHYVRLVGEGSLYPFGHRAAVVQISERKIQRMGYQFGNSSLTVPFAYLRRHCLLIVREREKTYPQATEEQKRCFPFRRVCVETEVTPWLDASFLADRASWPSVGGRKFRFKIRAEDYQGHWIELECPLAWIPKGVSSDSAIGALSDEGDSPLRCDDLNGQALTLAYVSPEDEEADEQPDEGCYPVHALQFGASLVDPAVWGTWFCPELVRASLELPSAERISGKASGALVAKFDKRYLNEGFGPGNPGRVFANFTTETGDDTAGGIDLDLPVQRAGGLAAVRLRLTALSRRFGPTVGNAEQFADLAKSGGSDPVGVTRWLEGARLLGGIELASLVSKDWQGRDSLPAILSYRTQEGSVTELEWNPRLRNIPDKVIVGADAELKVHASFHSPAEGRAAETTSRIEGRLTHFVLIVLRDYLALDFESLEFTAGSGRAKPDFAAHLKGVRFLGPLRFLDALWSKIPYAGFSDPPTLDVDDSGIRVGYGLGIPELPLGAFVMRNIRLAAAMTLPFSDTPLSVRFAFGERHDPFQVFVSLLGGGAFFGVVLRADGVETLEGAVEIGGGFVLDIGVARGSVEAMVGIYFRLSDTTDSEGKATEIVTLEGYQRCCGEVEVLGLVSVSVEFYMSLAYEERDGSTRVVGRARVTVKVRVAFFKKSVGLELERSFSGSGSASQPFLAYAGHPSVKGLSFADVMSFDIEELSPAERARTEAAGLGNYWELYCDAFYAPPAGGQQS